MNTTREPTKLTPLYSTARGLDAQFVEREGWRLPETFSSVEAEVAAARQGVALADESANGKLLVEGQRAETVLQKTWDVPSLAIGAGATAGPGQVYRLRADLFFVSTPPGAEAGALQPLTTAAREAGVFVTVTDLTHGRAELRLVGPASTELLSRLCGLDFRPSAFPDLTARQSSVARTAQLIVRRDLGETPAFSLIGARSSGAYLWDTIMRAGRDLGIAPLGQAALHQAGRDAPSTS